MPSSALNIAEQKPAIIQAAKRNCAWYSSEIKRLSVELTTNAERYRQVVKEFKESLTWKEEFKTWDKACQQVLQISKRRANELISSLTENYWDEAGTPLPTSEKLPPADHIEKPSAVDSKPAKPPKVSEPQPEQEERPVVHSADENKRDDPKPQNNGHAKIEPPKPEPIKDSTGLAIPASLLPTWNRRQDVQDLMTLASKLKCAIETIYEKSDPIFRGGVLNSQAHIASLNAIHYQLSQCKPGVVCPECNGDFKDDHGRECKTCRLTGFISESDWHQRYEKSNTSFVKAKVEERNGVTRLSA